MSTTGNDVTNRNGYQESFDPLVDDQTLVVYILVQYCIISSLINIFGIITNVINIIVFIKQGFRDPINISLLGLAISDLGSLISLQWMNFCFSPFMWFSDLPFISLEVSYLTAGWPRMVFTHITGWITAFITFERCICIVMPLKVKLIITPTRTAVIIIAIFIAIIGSVAPSYYTSRLVWKFVPERNRTLLGLGFTPDRRVVDSVVFAISNGFLPFLAFVIVVICTAILALKLNSKANWRKQVTAKAEQVSSKDRKIVQMVILISSVFIICFLPMVFLFSSMAFEPELGVDGKYRNVFLVTGGLCFCLESINSTINIFLYLKMSSKYKETFTQLFHLSSW